MISFKGYGNEVENERVNIESYYNLYYIDVIHPDVKHIYKIIYQATWQNKNHLTLNNIYKYMYE